MAEGQPTQVCFADAENPFAYTDKREFTSTNPDTTGTVELYYTATDIDDGVLVAAVHYDTHAASHYSGVESKDLSMLFAPGNDIERIVLEGITKRGLR